VSEISALTELIPALPSSSERRVAVAPSGNTGSARLVTFNTVPPMTWVGLRGYRKLEAPE
jgi:hypothetical protein